MIRQRQLLRISRSHKIVTNDSGKFVLDIHHDRNGLAALKAIYAAVNADPAELALGEFEAGDLAKRYLGIAPSWRRACNEVIAFLDYPPEIRRLIYAAAKLIYLALNATATEWKRSIREWHAVRSQLAITFEDRFPMAQQNASGIKFGIVSPIIPTSCDRRTVF